MCVYFLGQLSETFGILYDPKSGHTASGSCVGPRCRSSGRRRRIGHCPSHARFETCFCLFAPPKTCSILGLFKKWRSIKSTDLLVQCGQIWQPFATSFKSLWQFYLILQLAKFLTCFFANNVSHWANFYCCKWPNIEQIIQPSGHTACYLPPT